MFSKIFSPISALLVVAITILPSSKVESQALVEFALILVVVAFDKNERAEIYWHNNAASPQAESQLDSLWMMSVAEVDDSNCTQNILTQVTRSRTLSTLSVEYAESMEYAGVKELVITSSSGDHERVVLDSCFDRRIVAEIGIPVPPARAYEISRQLASNPGAPVAGMPQVKGGSIVDAETGGTKTQITLSHSQFMNNVAIGGSGF